MTKGFDAKLANRPFKVFDFRALWRSTLSARVPEASLASYPLISIAVLEALSSNELIVRIISSYLAQKNVVSC